MDDDLIIPSTTTTLSSNLRQLHKDRRNDRIAHLRSIDHDAKFIALAHTALGSPPMFANLRCGVWYVPPSLCAGHCYYKSTDGHAGCWDFSLSRLNLQTALAAASHGRVVIVDSTRSGKRFPDALTKTVPIWCCVINRALATDDATNWDCSLHLPSTVPPSEASQIASRLDGWVAALRRPALSTVLEKLREALKRPLRPSWLCPPDDGPRDNGAAAVRAYAAASDAAAAASSQYAWVHCVCASEACSAEVSRERGSYTYIQGAGDDEENWSRGVTALDWWRWRDELMRLAVHNHEEAEERLVELLGSREDGEGATAMEPPTPLWTTRLLLASRRNATLPKVYGYCEAVLDVGSSLSETSQEDATTPSSTTTSSTTYLHLPE